MSELVQVVAYVFRRQGRDRMARNEFKQLLSFRLNWYPPAQASQLLERAVQAGLLAAEGDEVRLGFPAEQVELPVHFRGTARALEEPLPGHGPTPGGGALPPSDPVLEDRVRALRELARGTLSEDAARLLAMRERGLDVRAEAARLLAGLGASSDKA